MSKMTVHCHGYLKQLVPEPITLEASTAAEAINGLCKSTKALNADPLKGKHLISVLGFDTRESLYCPTEATELHLYPAMRGGKSGGFLQIAIGAVLIAASFIPGLNVAIWAGYATTWASLAFTLGVSFALGGVLQLLSPAPNIDLGLGPSDPAASLYLGAPQNTVKIGTRIPFAYGEIQVGGQYVSFDIQAQDVAV